MSLRSFFVNLKEYLNLNALPVPLLRQVYFLVFFDVFFERVFSGVREVFFSVLCGFWGPSGGHFWKYF